MKLTIILLLCFFRTTFAAPVELTVGSDTLAAIGKIDPNLEILHRGSEISLIRFDEQRLVLLSELMHVKFGRCPGFTKYFSEAEAVEDMLGSKVNKAVNGLFTLNYEINQQLLVAPLVSQVDEIKLLQVITKLVNFKSRYHTSKGGRDAVSWLKGHWESLAQGRGDVTVKLFKHRSTPQQSVIMTIKGTLHPEQVVIVGGHIDSIARNFLGRVGKIAPGADDNASGIATITEVIRILMDNSYQPERTIKFMAYAAEEVGLIGSREIATRFKREGVQVVGVMQLDMTNYKGSQEDIVFMTDYTNREQNKFLQKVIDTYVKVRWGTDRCGYACSDHASWSNAGFPASMPFESKVREMNHKIHTKRDTLKVSDNHALHAIKFAKMAVAFVVELDR